MPAFEWQKKRETPEAELQRKIVKALRDRGWYTIETHGNAFQKGLTDIVAMKAGVGVRFIEVKNPDRYGFTPAQLEKFPQICAHGSGVWILVDDTPEELKKLYGPPNWHHYLKGLHRHYKG